MSPLPGARPVLLTAALVGATQSVSVAGLRAQAAAEPDTSEVRTVVPGARYRAGGVHAFVLGKRWRDLWTAPIDVPVLDLLTFGGGLTPVGTGGGGQTRTLIFESGDGLGYRFRSLDKVRAMGLDPELRGTLAEDILQDQTSALHPGGAPVVVSLMEELSLLNPRSRLVLLPDDPLLGEHREDFAGMVGLIEDNVNEGPDHTPGFAGATEVASTEELLEALRSGPRHRVDAREYLTARLLDILVGDRDRHPGQIRWVRVEEEGGFRWRPVPLDRDEAFFGIDGLYGALVRGSLPKLVPFEHEYPSIRGLTWNGWSLDRLFLSRLDRATWDSVTASVQGRVTDETIDRAVARLPEAMEALNGDFLRSALRQRRDRLPEASDRFYEIVAREAEIETTDRAELILVERREDGAVEVRAWELGEDPDAGAHALAGRTPWLRRLFVPWETEEVRLYLRGGDDRVVVRPSTAEGQADGTRRGTVRVRLLGEAGDEIYDGSQDPAPGYTEVHDAEGRNSVRVPDATRVRTEPYERPPPEDEFHFHALDWGAQWYPVSAYDYNTDHGLVLAGGRRRFTYDFRKDPYGQLLTLLGGISTDGRILLEVTNEWIGLRPGMDAVVHARFSGLDKLRFYGFGNDAPLLGDDDFHALDQYTLELDPRLRFSLWDGLSVSVGPLLEWSTTERGDGILATLGGAYGDGVFWQAGSRVALDLDRTDHPVWPRKGVRLRVEGNVLAAALDVTEPYQTLGGTLVGYVPLPRSSVLALRVGGERAFGDRIPFQHAPMVGSRRVRGLNSQRFRGDGGLWGNAEVRFPLARIRLPVIGFSTEVGLLGFGDGGRIYLDGESPGGWSTAGGGGIWASFIDRNLTFRLVVAQGEETRLKIGGGFRY